MVVQIVSVVAVILDHRWKEWPVYGNFVFPVHWIAYVCDLVRGLRVAGFGDRLLCRLLVED